MATSKGNLHLGIVRRVVSNNIYLPKQDSASNYHSDGNDGQVDPHEVAAPDTNELLV